MDLNRELEEFKAEFARTAPVGRPALYDAKVEELRASFAVDRCPQVGATIPEFELPDVHGEQVSLDAVLSEGPVVITFYRGGWCPYCNLQLRAYQAVLPEIRAHGAHLLAISPEQPDGSLSTTEQNELTFDVLSDVGNQVARRYGLAHSLPEELREVHRLNGKDLTVLNGDDKWELPVPGTFVVDRSGIVVLSHVDVDYRKRLAPDDILAALRTLSGSEPLRARRRNPQL